jgi:hypothetical protein
MNPLLPHSRRHFLASSTFGLGGIALAWLLHEDGALAGPVRPELKPQKYDLTAKAPHHPPRARAMISLFMQGGPSHIDLLDPKPLMAQYDGKPFPSPGDIKYDNRAQATARVLASPWKFQPHGECGTEVSELLPHLAEVVDDITVVRSIYTGVNNHEQSIRALNNGSIFNGRPVLGSWVTYGLGTVNQNLPAYLALPDSKSLPVIGVDNWSNGWLPSLYQGTAIRPREPRIPNLDAPPQLQGAAQEHYLDYLQRLNRRHLDRHPGELDLEARIASYELAAHMQTAAKEALDISRESKVTKELYGLDDPATAEYGTRCLIARRLVERGVRFVQVFTSDQFWDHHGGIVKSLPAACKKTDQPAAALVKDLKARGLLETTIVHWGGEMGRLPVIQNDAGRDKIGRDHNTYGFSIWLAGGGFKGGCVYGQTDDFGHKAVADRVSHHDYHATILHLFGLDIRRLVYQHNGREQSLLDDQPGRVVRGILS